MIPIKNFKFKMPHMAKQANTLSKKADIVKNFKMPFIQVIANKIPAKKIKK